MYDIQPGCSIFRKRSHSSTRREFASFDLPIRLIRIHRQYVTIRNPCSLRNVRGLETQHATSSACAFVGVATTFRVTSREKSHRISMPRCLPTSAAEWIPGVGGGLLPREPEEFSGIPLRDGRPLLPPTSRGFARDVASATPTLARRFAILNQASTRVPLPSLSLSVFLCVSYNRAMGECE